MSELTPEERQRIYEEEKARRETGQPAPVGQKKPFPRGILISALCTILVLGGAGKLAYNQYRLHGLKQKLGEAIGKDLGLTETILKIETESSEITYEEIFDLCNKSVENRTNLIVELRGLYPEMDYQLKTRLVEYLSAENDFVRAKRNFYRKIVGQLTAARLYLEELGDRPTSVYGWALYRDRLRQLREEAIKAAREAEESADEFLKLYENMAIQEQAIAKEAQAAGLRFEPIFQKHAGGNQNRAEEVKQGAQRLAKLF